MFHHDNVYVFLDIGAENERIGRVIIQLENKIVPRTAENFRALCTGEKGIGIKGKPLHYKNSFFHRTMREFMIQGGDITNCDGTGGESIYGSHFEDENFIISHEDEGIVSMANTGEPNTNNSQFFITVAPCTHLDGKNVAFGKVVRGYNLVKEISETEFENDRPTMIYRIVGCGQLDSNINCYMNENDGTVDVYPTCPPDWKINNKDPIEPKNMIKIVTNIKNSGNFFYSKKRFYLAGRKYKKAMAYIKFFTDELENPNPFKDLEISCMLNFAAVELKLHKYKDCLNTCNKILEKDANNAKAAFRKGQACVALHEYDIALNSFYRALSLVPNDKTIIMEIRRTKRSISKYLSIEKQTYAKMFDLS